jgi:N-methylhydantoinase B/oxoprolinase/acetone carboxylase alpha subunit
MSSGGTGVTSMNPVAKELWEEGLAVESFRLVSQGQFEEEAVKQLFMDVAKRPGCSATRRIDHNITDLQGKLTHHNATEFGLTRSGYLGQCKRDYSGSSTL